MAWSAADDAVVAYHDSPEFAESALAWARENMRCETCRNNLGNEPWPQCSRGVEEEVGPRDDWGCTLWEPKP